MVKLGEEEKLSKGNLPLRSQVFAHYLYLRRQKVESGEWKSNVSVNDAARAVKVDVQAQWEKTGIPHSLDGQAGDKKVERLILKCRKMQKKTVEDRDKNFGQEFDSLFDVASCQDKDPESCNCPAGLKVPPNWVAFLQDQRSSRLHTNTLLSDRAQSLRGGIRDLTFEEKNEHQRALEKFEEKIQREKRMVERKRKPLLLPPYPSNTQRVEQMVRVVTEASTARVGYEGRQSLIVQKLKSRKLVKSFNSKMQDAKFD